MTLILPVVELSLFQALQGRVNIVFLDTNFLNLIKRDFIAASVVQTSGA